MYSKKKSKILGKNPQDSHRFEKFFCKIQRLAYGVWFFLTTTSGGIATVLTILIHLPEYLPRPLSRHAVQQDKLLSAHWISNTGEIVYLTNYIFFQFYFPNV